MKNTSNILIYGDRLGECQYGYQINYFLESKIILLKDFKFC